MTTNKAKSVTKGGRPTKKQSENISKNIISKGRKLFIENGVAATTMEMVAEACGISKDTLYRRFSSKEMLFNAVVEEALNRTVIWFKEHEKNSPEEPILRVRHLTRWFLAANLDLELLSLKREAMIEAINVRPIPRQDPFTPTLIKALSDAQATGAIKAIDPEFLAQQIIASIVLGPMTEALMGGSNLHSISEQDSFFDRSWNLFLEGAAVRL